MMTYNAFPVVYLCRNTRWKNCIGYKIKINKYIYIYISSNERNYKMVWLQGGSRLIHNGKRKCVQFVTETYFPSAFFMLFPNLCGNCGTTMV